MMNIPTQWEVVCPDCGIKTRYVTVGCQLFDSLTAKCTVCATKVEIEITEEMWLDFLSIEEIGNT